MTPRAHFAIHRATFRVAGLRLLKTRALHLRRRTQGLHNLPGAGLCASITTFGAITPVLPVVDKAHARFVWGTLLAAIFFVCRAVLAAVCRVFLNVAFAAALPARHVNFFRYRFTKL